MWYRADMKEAVIQGRYEGSSDIRQMWTKLWYRAYIKKLLQGRYEERCVTGQTQKAVIQGRYCRYYWKLRYKADIKNAVVQGRHEESFHTGQTWRKLSYRADIKEAFIQDRHEGSCDIRHTLRKLWYRADMKESGIKGRHKESCYISIWDHR